MVPSAICDMRALDMLQYFSYLLLADEVPGAEHVLLKDR
jgi:hypothetical protein